jgi:hypothetical protein
MCFKLNAAYFTVPPSCSTIEKDLVLFDITNRSKMRSSGSTQMKHDAAYSRTTMQKRFGSRTRLVEQIVILTNFIVNERLQLIERIPFVICHEMWITANLDRKYRQIRTGTSENFAQPDLL